SQSVTEIDTTASGPVRSEKSRSVFIHIIIGTIFLFLGIKISKAQKVYIPDVNFRAYLVANFPTAMTIDSLDTMNPAVLSATKIDVKLKNISNLTGIQYFTALKHLNCRNNQLASLPPLPTTLEYLWCSQNPMPAFPTLPAGLDSLTYSSTNVNGCIKATTVLPPSLSYLVCTLNQMTGLPTLPASLIHLNCSINQLTGLPALPPLLQTLMCTNNKLTSLPALPSTLTYLDFSGVGQCAAGNTVSTLPALPNTLTYLNCSFNMLTSLPALPDSLKTLMCSGFPAGQYTCTNAPGASNQFTSLPTLPPTLTKLVCVGNGLTALPALPATLKHLDCSGGTYYNSSGCTMTGLNRLANLPALPNGLTYLNCGMNYLTSLPSSLPDSLKTLICQGTVIGGSGYGCGGSEVWNQIGSLPALPPTLTYLNCIMTNLTALPSLPNTITYINCSYNALSTLPALPDSLKTLYCHNDQLTNLPPLPSKLMYLYCGDQNCSNGNNFFPNQITVLPALPATLKLLSCCANQISVMPALPAGMTSLSCGYNLLTSLPPLPATLTSLICHHNQLTALPPLPPSLTTVYCNHNQLTALPALHQGLLYLYCDNNSLYCLPLIPTSVTQLHCKANYLTCLPNHPPTLTVDVPGIPVCTNSNSTCHYNFISGNVYVDANNNCAYDAGELPIANQIIKLNNSLYASSDTSGYYIANTDTGAYTVDAVSAHPLLQITCPQIPYSVQLTDSIKNIDFPETADLFCSWLWVDIATNRQRVCQKNYYVVNYCNYGSAPAQNAYIDITFNAATIPLSSTLPWTSVTGNTYHFNIGTVAVGACSSFVITDSVSCNAAQLETVCAKAEIFPANNCYAASINWDHSNTMVNSLCNNDSVVFKIKNNGTGNMSAPRNYRVYSDNILVSGNLNYQLNSSDSLILSFPANGKSWRVEADQDTAHPGKSKPRAFKELCGQAPYSMEFITQVPQDDQDDDVEIDCIVVSNSCDPNEKTVSPSGISANHYISNSDELEYTIKFQNVGNDTAYKVVVVDELDAQTLDISTLQTGASSFPYTFEVYGNGAVRWTFNNINLTDTITNELGSHGFVKFKIKQKANNAPGTVINNIAKIFFDNNSPIATNTAMVTIEIPTAQAATPTGNSSFCINPTNSVYTTTGSAGAADYTWSLMPQNAGTITGNGTSATVDWNNTFSGTAFIAVAGMNFEQGPFSNPLAVIIDPIVTPSVNISNGTIIPCAGTTVTFTATPTNGGTAPAYQWLLNGANTGSSGAQFSSNTFITGDKVKCILTSNANCLDTNSSISPTFILTIDSFVTPAVSIVSSMGSNTVCAGIAITFNAVAVNGGTNPVYQWMLNGVNTGSNSPSFTANNFNNADVVNCTLTSNENCLNQPGANSMQIIVAIDSVPATPFITQAGTLLSSSAATGNQWYLDGVLIPGEVNQFCSVIQDGSYTVISSNGNCSSASSVPVVFVTTKIESVTDGNLFSVYPNPSEGNFTFSFSANTKTNYKIELKNSIGQLIYSETLIDFTGKFSKTLNVAEYGKGIYSISITDQKNSVVKKLIVQ
ncbi:MAG: T9SS type A sorting domain-containing protein, partial [Bacteroidia bacterium]|nr:T9SS type A sorting domain-containing protein [Bacteroidia bacterium]